MKNENLYALIESRLPREPGAACIETAAGLIYSWQDVHFASARIAGWLASLNLPRDARVVAQVEKSPEALLLYLATLRAGLVYVPLNTAYQRAELEYLVGDAQPSVLVCAPGREHEIGPLAQAAGCRHVMTLGEQRDGTLLAAAAPFADRFETGARAAGDPAVIIYTSGTTGRSKGAMLSHGNLAFNALTLDEFWGFREERDAGGSDVLLHALPLYHVHGLFVASHAALIGGAQMIFLPKFDPRQVIRYLPRSTVMMGVPTYYTRLLAEASFDRHSCRNMRLFLSGSAPLSSDTFEAFRRRCGHTIVERYGMSETMMLTSNPYFGTARDRIGGTVGVSLPGVAVRVVRDDGSRCVTGEIGHVQVKGPGLFLGYWQMPEKTAQEFTADGYFMTGDVGHFGAAKSAAGTPANYLTLVGRSKDLIISGGYNVYPKEIEGYIDAMPGVVESAVFGLPHTDLGEAVAAVVVGAAEPPPDGEAIIAGLKAKIANYKVPKRVWIVTQLPRNAMGKVQKNLLREMYAGAFKN